MKLYKVVTYILLVAAGFIALPILMLLPAALGNPILLITLVIGSSLVIYSYTSYRFLKMGVDEYFYCKPSLRKLIRFSSFAALGIAALSIIEAGMMIAEPQGLKKQIEESLKAMPAGSIGNEQFYTRFIMSTPWIMLSYYLVLIPHIFYTWRLLKRFARVFEPPATQDQQSED